MRRREWNFNNLFRHALSLCDFSRDRLWGSNRTPWKREKQPFIHIRKGKTNTQLVETRLDPSSGKCFPAGSKFGVIFMVIAHSCSKLRRQTLNYSDVRYSGLNLFCIYRLCLHCTNDLRCLFDVSEWTLCIAGAFDVSYGVTKLF